VARKKSSVDVNLLAADGEESSMKEVDADKPVYCCVNIEKGAGAYRQHVCKYALCNPCWSKAMLGDETGNGTALAGSRRKPMRGV
jgi:hypothetical protein